MSLTTLVLGTTVKNNLSGYDIHKLFCNENGINLWPASHQQVYRECNKLQDNGYLAVEHIPQAGKPDKKVYTTTPKGEIKLTELVLEEFEVEKKRNPLMVALMFLPELSKEVRKSFWDKVDDVRSKYSYRIEELDNQISVIDELKAKAKGFEEHSSEVIRFRLVQEKIDCQGEIDFLDRIQIQFDKN